MPLLGLDSYAYPFVAVKIEVAAFAVPDPGLLCGVAGRHGVLESNTQEARVSLKAKAANTYKELSEKRR